MEPETDRALVAACLADAPGAWDRFVARCGGAIVAAVRRTIGTGAGAADVEDAAAEVMAALVADGRTTLRAFRGEAKLTTFLRVVARRTALAWREGGARGPALASPEALALAPGLLAGPVEEAIRRDAAAAVARALTELLPRDREALHRFYALGQSGAEIGAALGLPESQITVLLHRARERARLVLARYPGLRP